MEDLATDRIYRLMIAQRMRHSAKVAIADEHGNAVEHTHELITRLFDEELEKILAALPAETPAEVRERYERARQISEAMIVNGEVDPI
jgi:malate synthase